MKYGIIYEYSKFGNTIQLISTYRNFDNPPIESNKAFSEQKDAVKILLFSEQKDAVKILLLFDSKEERKAFDRKIVLPRWSYSMGLAKKKLEKIFNQFQDVER